MASDHELDPRVNEPEASNVSEPAPLDLLQTDDRLLTLERESAKYGRHLSKVEISLSNQMLTVSVLEVVLALVLAGLIWSEYRRRTEEVRHGAN